MDFGLVVAGDLQRPTGGYRYDRKLVSHLRDRGDTVDVVSVPERRYYRSVLDGIDPRTRDRLDIPVDVLLCDGICHPLLWRHVRTLERPETVLGLVQYLWSDDPRVDRFRIRGRIERRFLRSVDGIVATSQFLADRIATHVDPPPIVVAPPAGRVQTAAVSETFVESRSEETPFRVLFLGSVTQRKDPESIVAALDRLDRSGRLDRGDWHLRIVGDDTADESYASTLRSEIHSRGLGERIDVTGIIPTARLESAFEESHVCCVPSRYEPFGMALLEAMEYGVVPIAGTAGGTGEFIRHGENGFLVTPGDTHEIAETLELLACDRSRLARCGVRARATAVEHPTWTDTVRTVRSFCADRL